MAKIKNICILGSTGSIGKNCLEVVAHFPDKFRVRYLTAHTNIHLLEKQIKRFRPEAVVVLNTKAADELRHSVNGSLKIFTGERGLEEIVVHDDIDIVVNSLVGFAGLRPTIEAIKLGKTILLANKETLVVAGEIITKLLKKHKAQLIPIDSEHSAILQCLAGEKQEDIAKLILTASGGPFLNLDKKKFRHIKAAAALNHPNWKMGNKITIDSATLMNKGLEVIEAHWLFGLPSSKIEVLIHPQSIIHSMVEFIDGSVKAQLGVPDMKIPIQYALTYPNRAGSNFKRINFVESKEITFFKPDRKKFECLQLAYDALEKGGTAPAVLNAANEVAVEFFLHDKIPFIEIPKTIRTVLNKIPIQMNPSQEEIIEIDRLARTLTKNILKRFK